MKKICIVTTTRAEYGIMSGLIERFSKDSDVDFYLLVSGAHLSEKFGLTKNEIKEKIYKEIDIEIEETQAHSLALAIEKFDTAFREINPDLVIILGDRYEMLGVATAAMLNNLVIAHLHGGEATFGAIDEAIRHSITKMSHLHFTSCEEYRKRVIQLGENPNRVFNVGSLGVENIKRIKLMPKEELQQSLGFEFKEKNVLVTFHPVTLEKDEVKKQIKELIDALNELKDTTIIITMPNSDSGNDEIFSQIEQFQKKNNNVKTFTSLGVVRYLSTLQYIDMVIGNSSSGILEVPSFKIPTINIGNRQKGRIQAKSIINCTAQKDEILAAIKKGYELDCKNIINPYEKENTLENIINILKSMPKISPVKEFYDIN